MLSEEEVRQRRAELEERRLQKKSYRRRQILFYSVFFLIGLILMGVTARYTYRRETTQVPVIAGAKEERLQILFLGTDEEVEANVRSDSIMLISIDIKTGDLGILSIPRDTRVWVQSRERWERINSAYAHGGPKMAMEAVSHLLGVPVYYYVHTDFQGFQKVVDLLGGVEINVDKRMQYSDQAQNLYIDLQPGLQTLDGEKALQYVRYRDRLGDIALVDPFNEQYDGRVERQRKFLEALTAKVLSPSSIPKLPQLVAQGFKIVNTNLPWEKVLNLTLAISKFSLTDMKTAVLPGNSRVVNEAWYWVVNEDKARAVIDSVVLGTPTPLKITVLNGSGRAGVAKQVGDQLKDYGYNVVSQGNADHFDYQTTQVLASSRDLERVKPLADYLNATVMSSDLAESEVTVILGKDSQ